MTMPSVAGSSHSAAARSASCRQTAWLMFWLPTLAICSAPMRARPAS
ncbi:Uncharacterised protein [Bordetella pertussis]|nr:Uncharacterised protein [Bordetella pertussis]